MGTTIFGNKRVSRLQFLFCILLSIGFVVFLNSCGKQSLVVNEKRENPPVREGVSTETDLELSRAASIIDQIANEGDLIFQISQSAQAPALVEGTGSHWTHVGILFKQGNAWMVGEASSGVTLTPVANFIAKGKGKRFVIRRMKPELSLIGTNEVKLLKAEFQKMLKTPYDIFFEWADNTIYCSELTWKLYDRALRLNTGLVQKWGDMRLDGPEVQKLIRLRYIQTGKPLNLLEPIVTPVAQFTTSNLSTIFDSAALRRHR